MELIFVIIAALAPVIIALWYVFKKDSAQPEPTKWLVKAFFFGVLSALLSFVFSTPTSLLFGMEMSPETYPSTFDAFADAFLLAAIPEELAKFIMLWFLLRKNPFFDEKFDGIVYAVFIGMGFAGIENVMYLFGGLEDGSWIGTGIARALVSIPGHFMFAVFMGYYYSINYFNIDRSIKTKSMILVVPIIAHGVFDGILFSTQVNEYLSVICMIAFIFFLNILRKKGKERIEHLMN